MEDYKFPCEPIANAESTVLGPHYRFTLIDDKVLRYEWAEDGVFEDRASTFAINRKFPRPEFSVEDSDNQLHIITPTFHLIYDKKRFSPNGLTVSFSSKQTNWGVEWRYGNQPLLNLGGTARTIDDVDGRCDMGNGIISKAGYAALDDTNSMLFDGNGFVAGRSPGDRIDGYLFCYGYDYKGAMKSFYAISGRPPVIPRWSLGNWWSRYYAYDQAGYVALIDKFKENKVPLSVAVIDMDWHVVKGENIPHTGWTGYTWNKDLFPAPKQLGKDLHSRGLKITLNDHPHAGIHHHEDLYDDTARALGHDTTSRAPILFDPSSPKFMYASLNVVHRKLEEECDFWWIDWQQGSYCRTPGIDPLWLLNHFHYIDQRRNKTESQSLIFSRYAGPGSHRYPVGFSGDSVATWDSLEFQPEFTATASNIGYGWWSHDIGGHVVGYRDDECTTRWVQLGAFLPILRLHSSNSRWMSKEPWLYNEESQAVMIDFLQLRHRLVPYIFTINAGVSTSNIPLIQPLYWNFPSRKVAYRFPNEYYFGPSLVVAPVVCPRDKRTYLAKTRVWVPPGRHVDIFTGSVFDGDREIDMYRQLRHIPVLAREGSIIPLDRDPIPANGCDNPSAFEVLVVVGQDGQFNIIENSEDDQEQTATETQRSILIDYNQAAGRLTTVGAGREWTFRFVSLRATPSDIRVLIDGSELTEVQISIETIAHKPSTVVKLPDAISSESSITIEIGADPQLAVMEYTNKMSDLLVSFQIENKLKDRMWEVIDSTKPTTIRVGGLLSLGLDEALFGPFLELMLSDSRSG